MTGLDIITEFELQVNDITELSSTEELAIANRIYRRVCNERPWEFLKKPGTGVLSYDATAGMYYITMPTDFAYFIENSNSTDNASAYEGVSNPKNVYIGSNYDRYEIVNFSDRLKYRTRGGFAYMDWANGKIWFPGPTPNTALSTSTTYSFDYISTPVALATNTSPVFPAQFHEIIVYGMASENDILQLSDKARSYQKENETRYQQYLLDMAYWNSLQYQN